MFDKTHTYASFNLVELNILPVDWVLQVSKVAEEDSYFVKLDGKSSTSREPENTNGAEVYVVEGNIIAEKLNWLHKLYQGKFLEFANANFGGQYDFAKNIKSGININLLKGKNARYEWHVDSNPLTGVLFVTTHDESDGGELVFKLPTETLTIYPKSGTLILFDARQVPHTVLPLQKEGLRISVPLNFYKKGQAQIRPDDLDSYIYKKPNQ
jgi:2OG-Fe(II) oxygenase superfamily